MFLPSCGSKGTRDDNRELAQEGISHATDQAPKELIIPNANCEFEVVDNAHAPRSRAGAKDSLGHVPTSSSQDDFFFSFLAQCDDDRGTFSTETSDSVNGAESTS